MSAFSARRFAAILLKEFTQMRRDRATFAMMLGVPIMQLFLFGFAINNDPKRLPTSVVMADQGPYGRAVVAALYNSDYFEIVGQAHSPAEAERWLDEGSVAFSVEIPADFTRDLVRGQQPQILIQADASDPTAAANALAAASQLAATALKDDLVGPLAGRAQTSPFDIVVQRRYNPEGITQYNIVPGLLGVMLTMTRVAIAAMAMTRERERGTLENLLAMPASPFEVMMGKIVPFIVIGYVQVSIVLLAAHYVYKVPMLGSIGLLLGAVGLFVAALLAVGFTFSTFAKSQLQAMQMSMFFLLPSILLSGFAFPFRGMPDWAQYIGDIFPATYFLRIVRGILLKGNGFDQIWPSLWPLLIFTAVSVTAAMLRYQRTLD